MRKRRENESPSAFTETTRPLAGVAAVCGVVGAVDSFLRGKKQGKGEKA